MGQDLSQVVDDDTPPETLEARDVASVAKYIKERPVKNVVIMVSKRGLRVPPRAKILPSATVWSWHQHIRRHP